MPNLTLRSATRNDRELPSGHSIPSLEDLKTGCLLRIADSVENMAKSHVMLEETAERYKRWHAEERSKCVKLRRRISALQGVITKLKRKHSTIPS